ncbi:ribose-5-phosphate isomerase [Demequina aurantiaca]|uniref:ribose-5-phosphate isomerase n=1 Tax=Demequina aurantiaca TaxID=676200 RepID=UPI003D32A221
MRIHIGSDHAGFELKQHLVTHLRDEGNDVIDHGALEYDDQDDYPSFCISAAEGVIADAGSLGIVIGGSGNGEQIAANRVSGIRAALAWNVEIAQLARQHNDANVVSVGGRMHTQEEATAIIDAFLATPFSEGERHQRRIDQLTAYDQTK